MFLKLGYKVRVVDLKKQNKTKNKKQNKTKKHNHSRGKFKIQILKFYIQRVELRKPGMKGSNLQFSQVRQVTLVLVV